MLEVENVNKEIFHNYLKQLSEHKPNELKIVVIWMQDFIQQKI